MSGVTIVSRADRLGDLVLSLPAVWQLKRALPDEKIVLHVSAYAGDLARLALHNQLCDSILISDAKSRIFQGSEDLHSSGPLSLLALFHGAEVVALIRNLKNVESYGPRTKISSLWTFGKTFRQRRSQVKFSEMEYNLDLVNRFLERRQFLPPEFEGLPALSLPDDWTAVAEDSAEVAVFLNNGASARNWPLEHYREVCLRLTAEGKRVDLHYGGVGADSLKREVEKSFPLSATLRIQDPFPRLQDLIVYLSKRKKVIASSTGPLHLAHALGIPVLGIYPREPKVQSFKRWRPHGYWHSAPLEFLEF